MEQTDRCQRGVGRGEWMGVAKEQAHITHRHRQQCGDSQREGGVGDGWRWAKAGVGLGGWGHL